MASIAPDLTWVAGLALVTQVVGFSKSILIAHYLGLTPELDGYYLSQLLPSFLAAIITGAIQTGFLPEYARLKQVGDEESLARLRGNFLLLIVSLSLSISILSSIFAEQVTELVARQASEEVKAMAATSLRLLAFVLALTAITEYFAMVLQAELRFIAVAAAPIANALLGVSMFLIWPEYGVLNLMWGTVLGWLAQSIILVLIIKTVNRVPMSRYWRIGATKTQVVHLSMGIIPGLAISNIIVVLPSIIIAGAGAGAVSALNYAMRLNGALTQSLSMAVSNVLLPHFSTLFAAQDYSKIRSMLQSGFRLTWVISLVVPAVVWVAGAEILVTVFGHGRFDEAAVRSVHQLWFWLSASLFFILWGGVMARLHQAIGKSFRLSQFMLVGLGVFLLLSLGLFHLRGGVSVVIGLFGFFCIVSTLNHISGIRYLVRKHAGPLFFDRRLMMVTFSIGAALLLLTLLRSAFVPLSPVLWIGLVTLLFLGICGLAYCQSIRDGLVQTRLGSRSFM